MDRMEVLASGGEAVGGDPCNCKGNRDSRIKAGGQGAAGCRVQLGGPLSQGQKGVKPLLQSHSCQHKAFKKVTVKTHREKKLSVKTV